MWHELKSQNDIDAFMKSVASFHDACITGLSYTSGTYVNDDNAIVMVTEPYIYITFHSQMANFPKFEMELGLVDKFSINLHLDNSLEIYEATFKKKDDGFYWYSDEYANGNSNYLVSLSDYPLARIATAGKRVNIK